MPGKQAKTVALFEISLLNVTISMNLPGSGSYGCCYFTSYRGMEVVSKNFVVRASRGKIHGQAEDRVHEDLVYEAYIIRKLSDHPGVPLLLDFVANGPLFVSLCSSMGTRRTTNL